MKHNIENDLKSMGYRIIDNRYNIWGKPVGGHLLSINIDSLKIQNKFISFSDEIYTWDSKNLDKDNLINSIKEFEKYTKFDVGKENSNFNFLSQKEFYESNME